MTVRNITQQEKIVSDKHFNYHIMDQPRSFVPQDDKRNSNSLSCHPDVRKDPSKPLIWL